MSDKQNPSLDGDEPLPAHGEDSRSEKGETPRSYYYDDATGYEIYEGESDDDEDEKS